MKLRRDDTAALLIDIQDRLVPAIHAGGEVVAASARFIRGLRVLEVPVIPVRQYPKGLGDLAPELREALGEHSPSDKITFSAWDTPDLAQRIRDCGAGTLLVFGTETHICVLQTVLDLLVNGFRAVLVADCAGSRRPLDHEIALRRAEQAGAVLSTSESLLFELLGKAGTDTFKQISALVK